MDKIKKKALAMIMDLQVTTIRIKASKQLIGKKMLITSGYTMVKLIKIWREHNMFNYLQFQIQMFKEIRIGIL